MSFSCLGSVGMTWVHWIAYYCYDTELRKKYLGKIYWDWLPCQCWVHTGQINPKPFVALRESIVKELALGFYLFMAYYLHPVHFPQWTEGSSALQSHPPLSISVISLILLCPTSAEKLSQCDQLTRTPVVQTFLWQQRLSKGRVCNLWGASWCKEMPWTCRKPWRNFTGHPLWCARPLRRVV